MRRNVLVLMLVQLALLMNAPNVSAQPRSATPDVVITRDGGMMRGAIVESVPGDHVTITLSTGDTRVVPWANVEFAGPESDRPTAVSTPVPAAPMRAPQPGPRYGSPDTVEVHVVTEQEELSLHEVTGAMWTQNVTPMRALSFERLCGAPCTLHLPPGSHHFALSQGNGAAVPGLRLDLSQGGTLSAHYVDRSMLRLAGILTMFVGGLAGVVWAASPWLTSDPSDPSSINDFVIGMIGGASVMVVAEIVGLILSFHGDSAELRFE